MSTQRRVQAGVPTGGQFAPSAHDEPGIDLANPDPPAITGEQISHARAETAAIYDDFRKMHQVQRSTELRTLRLLATSARIQWPTARYLKVEPSDQGDYMCPVSLLDTDGEDLGADLGEEFANEADPVHLTGNLPWVDGGAPYWSGYTTNKVAEQFPDDLYYYTYIDLDRAAAITERDIAGQQQPAGRAMNLTDVVTSPRSIANGQGSWAGTLAQLIDDIERYDEQRASDLISKMEAEGRIPALDEDDDDGRMLGDFAHLITVEDVQYLTDDPNASVTTRVPVVATDDLADEMAEKYGISVQEAREGVNTYLGQINAIDHTDWDTDMDAEASETIRDSFAAYYA